MTSHAPCLQVVTIKKKRNQMVTDSQMLQLVLPYSGKFSLVQIFAEKRPDSSEEIFAVFIFVDAGLSGHTPTS